MRIKWGADASVTKKCMEVVGGERRRAEMRAKMIAYCLEHPVFQSEMTRQLQEKMENVAR